MATWVRLPIPLTTVCHNYSSENLAALQEQQVRKSITVHVAESLVKWYLAFNSRSVGRKRH